MTPHEIRMCVMDSMLNDDESVETILSSLNGPDDTDSWEHARGCPFTSDEVVEALKVLLEQKLITPAPIRRTESSPRTTVAVTELGSTVSWEAAWFHLEEEGRLALEIWLEAEGRAKYPGGYGA